jgi:iron complex outermembrane receptor protein
MSTLNRSVFTCCALVASTVLVPPAFSAVLELDEVTVTAQKVQQRALDTPVTLIVTQGPAGDTGYNAQAALANAIPALRIVQSSGPLTSAPRIHGVGNLGNIPNFEQAVGTYVDGVFISRQGLLGAQLFDVEQVEVLAGAQTTLYGKNVNAGAITIKNKKPSLKSDAEFNLRAGSVQGSRSAGEFSMSGVMGAQLGTLDSSASRLSISLAQQGGIDRNLFAGSQDRSFNGAQDVAVRGQLAFGINTDFVTRVSYQHTRSSADMGDADIFYGVAPAAINAGFGVPCPDNVPDNGQFCLSHAMPTTLNSDVASVGVEWKLSDAVTLSSLSAGTRYDNTNRMDADQLNISLLEFNDRQRGKDLQQELRFNLKLPADVSAMLGGYWYQSEFVRDAPAGQQMFVLGSSAPFVPLAATLSMGQPGQAGSLNSINQTTYTAGFTQLTYKPLDVFAVNAGARYQEEKKTSALYRSVNHATPSLVTVALLPSTVSADLHRSSSKLTWDASAQYWLQPDWVAYAGLSTGQKSGGFNGDWGRALASAREFSDEQVRHIETGLKWASVNHRYSVDVSGFHDHYMNYQEGTFVGLQFLVGNAESVIAQGVDLAVKAIPLDHWKLEAGASWSRARYETFTRGSCYFGRAANSQTTPGACDLSGEQLPNAPEWKLHADSYYEFNIGTLPAAVDLTMSYTDSYLSASSLDPRSRQKGFTDVGASFAGQVTPTMNVKLWGSNLLNERSKLAAAYMNLFASDPAYQVFLSPGRSIGLEVSIKAL